MSCITFYEKPGCSGDAQQKNWLRAAGHQLDVRNLLTARWSREHLLEFLGPLPVTAWFNRAAPAVKQGRVAPESLDAEAAIALLLADPLLIRRPLMRDAQGRCVVGFDWAQVHACFGLSPPDQLPFTTEGCVAPAQGCPEPSQPSPD